MTKKGGNIQILRNSKMFSGISSKASTIKISRASPYSDRESSLKPYEGPKTR